MKNSNSFQVSGFIPIIGIISSGKTTFLKALLGIDVLQEGISTTTLFVCLIKHVNGAGMKFYKVKIENTKIIKDGPITEGEENITKEMERLNKETNDEVQFYLLEAEIKYISNKKLLDNYVFMDVPGLNETKKNYIDKIFSVVRPYNIPLGIFVFDATDYSGDNVKNIFEKLKEKKCLKDDGNIFILNKNDNNISPGGEQEIIKSFRQKIYENLEKNDKVSINQYPNYFLPMNSLQYKAENKCDKDFKSMLLVELFNYIESEVRPEFNSFIIFLEKKLKKIKDDKKIKSIKKCKEDEYKDVENCLNEIKDKILPNLQKTKDEGFSFGNFSNKKKSFTRGLLSIY